MRYGRIEDIALFQMVNGSQVTIPDYLGGRVPPLVPLTPDGTNLYIDAGPMIQAGGILTPVHAGVIADVTNNIGNGIVNVGFEPSTGGHALVSSSVAPLTNFFQSLDNLITNGLHVVVRYASEFNGDNSWSRNPDGYLQAIRAVRQARGQTRVLLAFSPAINEAEGVWRSDTPGVAIRSYWIPGFFDVVSCTLYARPQGPADTLDLAVSRAVDNLVSYLAQVDAPMIGFDELGASGVADDGAPAQNNDIAIHRLMNAVLDDSDLTGSVFDYATIFLRTYWGRDATLKFLADANAQP